MRQYEKQPSGELYSAEDGGVIFDPKRNEYFSVLRNRWSATEIFADEPQRPANDVFSDIGKALLTIGTGGLAAPLLYSGDGSKNQPAPSGGETIDGVPVSQVAASTPAPGTTAAPAAPAGPPATSAGSPWVLDSRLRLYYSTFDGGVWYDPNSGKYFSGRFQVWVDSNPAAGGFAPPLANGIVGPLPSDGSAVSPKADDYERYALLLESKAGTRAGDANLVLAKFLRLPVSERIRFFLLFNQTEEEFDLDDVRTINRDTWQRGVDISSRDAYEARLRKTYAKPAEAANGDAWYSDVLGGVHLVGSGILGAFGLGALSETLENVEGDALPAWARKRRERGPSGTSQKGTPQEQPKGVRIASAERQLPRRPERSQESAEDDEFLPEESQVAANGSPRRSGSRGRGCILGRAHG